MFWNFIILLFWIDIILFLIILFGIILKYTKKTFTTEVVAGHCPECKEHTLLVGLKNTLYRCTTCGEDLEQKVNGVIKYLKPELAESVFNELAE